MPQMSNLFWFFLFFFFMYFYFLIIFYIYFLKFNHLILKKSKIGLYFLKF